MASPYVKKLAKDFGKSEKEMEDLWSKAKEITSETFNKKEIDFSEKEYSYTTGIIKNMLGIKEDVLDPSKFLNSELNAREFIETSISSAFPSLDKHLIPPEEEEENEEELGRSKQDGTGPYGLGNGPGQGKKDGSGLKSEATNYDYEPLEMIETSDIDDEEWGRALDEMLEKE